MAAITIAGNTLNLTAIAGTNTGIVALAQFSSIVGATIQNFDATLALGGWGDGTPTIGFVRLTIEQMGATSTTTYFQIMGSHTYTTVTPPGLPNPLAIVVTSTTSDTTTLTSPPGGGVTV